MSNFIALFDACVLYPAPLRDLLMHLVSTDLFRGKWSEQIHKEWIDNLLKNRADLNREKLERTKNLIDSHAGDCLVEGYESLIEGLTLPDPDDRHVLAAAIRCNASVIVTFNLEDFPDSKLKLYDMEAQHPDVFICHLLDLNPAEVCKAVKRQRANLKNPPKTINQYLDTLLEQRLDSAVQVLRNYAELL